MANDWTTNPYVIDSTEDSGNGGNISRIDWWPATATDDICILDGADNVIFEARAFAAAPNKEEYGKLTREFNPPRKARGINVSVLDGGTVNIYTTKRSSG